MEDSKDYIEDPILNNKKLTVITIEEEAELNKRAKNILEHFSDIYLSCITFSTLLDLVELKTITPISWTSGNMKILKVEKIIQKLESLIK